MLASQAVEQVGDSELEGHACTRCGAFAPPLAVVGRNLCEACIDRTIDPVGRHPPSARRLIGGTLRTLGRVWQAALAVTVAIELPVAVVDALLRPRELYLLLYWLVRVVAIGAVLVLANDALLGREAETWTGALARALPRWPRLALTLGSGVALTAFGMAVFLIPGVRWFLSFAAALPIALDESKAPPLRTSFARMGGHRIEASGAFLLFGIVGFVLVLVVAAVSGATVGFTAGLVGDSYRSMNATPLGTAFDILELTLTPVCFLPLLVLCSVTYVATLPDLPRRDPLAGK